MQGSGGPGPPTPLFWVKKEEMTEERKASWARKVKPKKLKKTCELAKSIEKLHKQDIKKQMKQKVSNYRASLGYIRPSVILL